MIGRYTTGAFDAAVDCQSRRYDDSFGIYSLAGKADDPIIHKSSRLVGIGRGCRDWFLFFFELVERN